MGIYLGHRFDNPYFDGGASLLIGVILMSVAAFLGYESKRLLIGEGAHLATLASIRAVAENDPAVESVARPLTMYFGPKTALLTLEVRFGKVPAAQWARIAARMEQRIRDAHPEIKHVFIEAGAVAAASDESAPKAPAN